MNGTKSIFASKTVWGGIIVVLAAAAGLLGYTITAEDQAALVGYIESAASIIGGLLVIWGRVTATKKIA